MSCYVTFVMLYALLYTQSGDTSQRQTKQLIAYLYYLCHDLIFFLQHYGVFLQVPGVFSIFRPRACTYRSEPDSCRLAYGTAPFGPIECKQLLMDVPCVSVH